MKFYATKLKLVFTLLNLLLSRLNKIMRTILTFLFQIFLTFNPFSGWLRQNTVFSRIFSYPAVCLFESFFILHTNISILFAFFSLLIISFAFSFNSFRLFVFTPIQFSLIRNGSSARREENLLILDWNIDPTLLWCNLSRLSRIPKTPRDNLP